MTTDDKAVAIFQELLDRSGEAMMAGDTERLLGFFSYPNTVETLEGRCVLEGPEEARLLFDAMFASFRARGVTDIVRRVTRARFKDADTIWATHETRYILHGKILAGPPHQGISVVLRTASGWKVSQGQFTVEADNPLSVGMAAKRRNRLAGGAMGRGKPGSEPGAADP